MRLPGTSAETADMRGDPSVTALVSRAADHDPQAWDELIERYIPLVWSICVRYQLSSHDTEDVSQSVWLLLVEHLGSLREPAALPGWLATTTRRECLRVLRVSGRYDLSGQEPDGPTDAEIEEEIITAERNAALRAAFAELPPSHRQLLLLLLADPPLSYAEISSVLGVRVGSIGPQRARCVDRLRRSRHLASFIDHGDTGAPLKIPEGEPHG
jgi:RNA polymerase sigma factor (sigma-70 family)